MKIEDCKTIPEFFGVEEGERVWVAGILFRVYWFGLNNNSLFATDERKALVGCLTGQLEWSKEPPKSEMTMDEEFGSCDSCGYEFNSELISEYEIEYCPKCGQKIEETMTEEEEKLLREVAAQYPGLERLSLDSVGNIVTSYRNGAMYHPFGWNSADSKAYTVLAPILKKYGEISLDDYR